jgi:hypothetical protein
MMEHMNSTWPPKSQARWTIENTAGLLLILLLSTAVSAQVRALPRNTYHLLNASAPPGVVAKAQVDGRRPGVGTFTAVSISGSQGLKVGLAQHGQFLDPIDAPVVTGMLVGAVYRFRVTNIPDHQGEELFPTLEIIDRTNPEPGREHRFPIPIVLTDEDLHLALAGSLVTRVIYLEDSETADPVAIKPSQHLTVDVAAHENALHTADVLGRPVAILRIGSRVPSDLTGDLTEYMYGCPPFVPLPTAPTREALIREGRMADVVPVERTQAIYSENPTEKYQREPALR